MSRFFTRGGDRGYTSLIGGQRVPKNDPRIELLGVLDEAVSTLGLARSVCIKPEIGPVLLQIQRDFYQIMAEIADPTIEIGNGNLKFGEKTDWVEGQIHNLSPQVTIPEGFIMPGDNLSGAALDMARTVIRRAERRTVELLPVKEFVNQDLVAYLNRVSSLCYILELYEVKTSGKEYPTMAKE
jgi:cob(I)alamin adenosyltransferase